MNIVEENQNNIAPTPSSDPNSSGFDYSFVSTVARVAIYDDLRSAPRVLQIAPAETGQFINSLVNLIYEQSHSQGGSLPYVVIREVTENFIHAQFKEIIVSILDHGNTVRFADQGPGISFKDKVQQPGFTSAVEPMKQYIRGVGSGLPIVREYLEVSHGQLIIEDNLGRGAVVTLSINENNEQTITTQHSQDLLYSNQEAVIQGQASVPSSFGNEMGSHLQGAPGSYYGNQTQPYAAPTPAFSQPLVQGSPAPVIPQGTQIPTYYPMGQSCPYARNTPAAAPQLSDREIMILQTLRAQGELGVTPLAQATGIANSSTHNVLKKLEEQGLVETTPNSKHRAITQRGIISLQALGL